jgi:hypothetical protein
VLSVGLEDESVGDVLGTLDLLGAGLGVESVGDVLGTLDLLGTGVSAGFWVGIAVGYRVGNVLSVGLGDESVGDVLGTLDLLGAGVSVGVVGVALGAAVGDFLEYVTTLIGLAFLDET